MNIVKRLRADRSAQNVGTGESCAPHLLMNAANEIEGLRRLIADVRTVKNSGALKEFEDEPWLIRISNIDLES